ncbi:LOW QUALITY PROTEIN: NXPE family member 1, partial [Macrochelys suwanniensis]
NFTFGESRVAVSLFLIHPQKTVSALQRAWKKGYEKIPFVVLIASGTLAVHIECGLNLTTKTELCQWLDQRDQEAFYCIKPHNVACEAFTDLKTAKISKILSNEKCKIRMRSPFPSGFIRQNRWKSAFCNLSDFTTMAQISTCLKKLIYLMGDSTVQWIEYFTKTANSRFSLLS